MNIPPQQQQQQHKGPAQPLTPATTSLQYRNLPTTNQSSVPPTLRQVVIHQKKGAPSLSVQTTTTAAPSRPPQTEPVEVLDSDVVTPKQLQELMNQIAPGTTLDPEVEKVPLFFFFSSHFFWNN